MKKPTGPLIYTEVKGAGWSWADSLAFAVLGCSVALLLLGLIISLSV